MDWILEPWPWYVSGPLIALIMTTLILFGKSFGMSSNLRTICSIGGAGKVADFFKFDWKAQRWNLLVLIGAVIGGWLASNYLSVDTVVELNPATVESLESLGFDKPGSTYVPEEIFGTDVLSTWQGLVILILGGLLIGFGTRYAGGCTSGHAISGLSNLQVPSLIAVIGFFLGGLLMTHLIIPHIF